MNDVAQDAQVEAPRFLFISASGASYLASAARDPSDSLMPHTLDTSSPAILHHVPDALREEKQQLLQKAIEEQSGPSQEEVEAASRETEITALEPLLVEVNKSIDSDAVIERDAAQAKEKQAIMDREAAEQQKIHDEQNDVSRRQEALDAEEKTEGDIGMPLQDKIQVLKDKMDEKRNN